MDALYKAVLGDFVTMTTRHLKKGDKIRLTGLGIRQVRKRATRMGWSPATGEAIKIKASKKVAFRGNLKGRCSQPASTRLCARPGEGWLFRAR